MKKSAGLKSRLNKAERHVTPKDMEVRFITIDENGRETGEAMIVRPNQPTEFLTYTPKEAQINEPA